MKEYLTIKEAQQLTSLGASTLCTLAERGEVFAIKEKGRWFIKTEDVMALQIKPRKEHTRRSRKGQTINKPDLIEYAGARTIPGVNPAPKHAKPTDERSWRDAPRFTYNDLLNQYERGIAEGIRRAHIKVKTTTAEAKEEGTC